MRGKTLTIISLSFVLVALVILFLILDKGEVKLSKDQKKPLIGEFSSKDITFFKIFFVDYYDRSKTYDYKIFKSNEMWYVSYSNITDRTDQKLANFIANIIGDIEKISTISSNEIIDPIQTLGFVKPNAIIEFDTKDKTNKLIIGNLTPTKDYYYSVLNNNYNEFYLIYAYKIDNITKYPQELRDRNLFTPEWTNISGIEYKPISQNQVMIFTNINQKWFSKTPVENILDSKYIESSFLKDIRSITIQEFIEDSKLKSKLISKTNSPLGYIKLFRNNSEGTIMILDKAKTNFYCFDPNRNIIFSIDYESTHTLFDSNYERFIKIDK
ncbi:MAG: DUF4340 domain-containing protein [Brevinematia bacterium]